MIPWSETFIDDIADAYAINEALDNGYAVVNLKVEGYEDPNGDNVTLLSEPVTFHTDEDGWLYADDLEFHYNGRNYLMNIELEMEDGYCVRSHVSVRLFFDPYEFKKLQDDVLDVGDVDMSDFKSDGSEIVIPIRNIWNLSDKGYRARCLEIFSRVQNIRFLSEYGHYVYSMAAQSMENLNGILNIRTFIMPDVVYSSSNGRSDSYNDGMASLALIDNADFLTDSGMELFEGYDPEIPLYVVISYSKQHESAGYSLQSTSRSSLFNKLLSNLKS